MSGLNRVPKASYDISKVGQREKLNQLGSKEPVWQHLAKGLSLGYRPSSQTWHARRLDKSGKRQFNPLGDFGTYPENLRYEMARVAAMAWSNTSDTVPDPQKYTVLDAVNDYIAHVASEGRAVNELENRRDRTIASHPIAVLNLVDLKSEVLRAWKLELSNRKQVTLKGDHGNKTSPKSAASINREMVLLKASLNFAHSNEKSGHSRPWLAALTPLKVSQGIRSIYLDKSQRAALVHAIDDANLKDFITAQCLIPIRPGAMAHLRCRDFDFKHKAITVSKDKAGEGRTVLLPDHLFELIMRHTAGKSSDDIIFTRQNGQPWSVNSWKKPTERAVLTAELPKGTTLYSLRHSVITDLLTNGVPASVVAKLAGTSIAMLERNYSKVLQDQNNRRVLECLI